MTDNNRSEIDRRALEACCGVRDDAVKLLASIESGDDTYFDRQISADVDMTANQATFFRSVINRMDIAIAALRARSGSSAPRLVN